MNVFEDEDHKPPWKVIYYPERHGYNWNQGGYWDIVSDRANKSDSYSIGECTIDNEKLCRLWAKAPELLEFAKAMIKIQDLR